MSEKSEKKAVTKTQLRTLFAAVSQADESKAAADKAYSDAVKAVHEAIGSAKVTMQDGRIVRAICRKAKEEGAEPKYFLRVEAKEKQMFAL